MIDAEMACRMAYEFALETGRAKRAVREMYQSGQYWIVCVDDGIDWKMCGGRLDVIINSNTGEMEWYGVPDFDLDIWMNREKKDIPKEWRVKKTAG